MEYNWGATRHARNHCGNTTLSHPACVRWVDFVQLQRSTLCFINAIHIQLSFCPTTLINMSSKATFQAATDTMHDALNTFLGGSDTGAGSKEMMNKLVRDSYIAS